MVILCSGETLYDRCSRGRSSAAKRACCGFTQHCVWVVRESNESLDRRIVLRRGEAFRRQQSRVLVSAPRAFSQICGRNGVEVRGAAHSLTSDTRRQPSFPRAAIGGRLGRLCECLA
jgi:hypothetical protein